MSCLNLSLSFFRSRSFTGTQQRRRLMRRPSPVFLSSRLPATPASRTNVVVVAPSHLPRRSSSEWTSSSSRPFLLSSLTLACINGDRSLVSFVQRHSSSLPWPINGFEPSSASPVPYCSLSLALCSPSLVLVVDCARDLVELCHCDVESVSCPRAPLYA